MNPEEILQEADSLYAVASNLIFETDEISRNRAVFLIFLIRQRVLSALGEIPRDSPDWISDLENDCAMNDLGYFSCMVHELVVHSRNHSAVNILARYQTIMGGIGKYLAHPRSKKIPHIRSLEGKSHDYIIDYEEATEEAMRSQVKDFIVCIEGIKISMQDGWEVSIDEKRQFVMEIIGMRESLHTIFCTIQDHAFSFLQEDDDLKNTLFEFNQMCFHALGDIPLLIEEVEEGEADEPIDSIASLINFLQTIAQKIDTFFVNQDYSVFKGVDYWADDHSFIFDDEGIDDDDERNISDLPI